MKQKRHIVMGVTGSVMLLGSMGANVPMAMAEQPEASDAAVIAHDERPTASDRIAAEEVKGLFAFSQTEVDSISAIAKNVGRAARYLCGSEYALSSGQEADALNWVIVVSGDVENAFFATQEELSNEGHEHAIMGCSCGGNVAGGTASVNAEVDGIPLKTIMEMARPSADANTIVFTSSDGYEVALPLFYVKHHHSLVVWSINGSPVADSMGGVNQLWLGSSPAFYFSKDIVGISFETRQTPPPTPGLDRDEGANLPNISVRAS